MTSRSYSFGHVTRRAAADAVRLYFEPLTWLRAAVATWRARRADADERALQARLRFDFLLTIRSFIAMIGNANVNWFADRALLADVTVTLRTAARMVDSILRSQLEELARLLDRLDDLGSNRYTAISLHVFTIQTQVHHRLVLESRNVNRRYQHAAMATLEETDRMLRTTFDRLARSAVVAPHNDAMQPNREEEAAAQIGLSGIA
jgi:hypothetical protein